MKLLENNTEENLNDLGFGKDFIIGHKKHKL